MTTRVPTRSRRVVAIVAGTTFAAVLVTGTITSSAASWTDREYDRSAVQALDCSAVENMDTRAWGRVLTGQLLTAQLDPIAALDGITVTNLQPATDSTGTSTAAPVTNLGSDAWSGALGLSVLNSLDLGAGLVLPLDAGTGAYTQYGRATNAGDMAAASGAVTTQAGGLASLTTPDANTPKLGTLRLSSVIDSVLPGLGVPVGALSDVDLEVGAVGSIAELDGCAATWDQEALADELNREYLVAGLDLAYTSDLVSGLGTSLATTLDTLETTLNGLLTAQVPPTAISSLTSSLTGVLGPIAGVSLGDDPVTASVSGVINLDPVVALLTNDLSDGVVTINLASGRVNVDLAALLGESYEDSDGLNGRDPNTSVLQPDVINALLVRISNVLNAFITGPVEDAITTAIYDTEVTVELGAHLDATVSVVVLGTLTVPNVVNVTSTISGKIGGFIGVPGYSASTASTSVALLDNDENAVVVTALNGLLTLITGPIVNGVSTTVRGTVGSSLVAPLVGSLTTSVTSTVATITGVTIPNLITELDPVLDALATLVRVTLNAQPDQPDSVGPPVPSVPGRYFVSALHVGVVNAGDTLLALWVASASVGPADRR